MQLIDENTRIAWLLKHHPDALEALVNISPRFNKLRNPLMRKLLAGRATISMAAGIAGIPIRDFFEKLKPLGFETGTAVERQIPGESRPAWMDTTSADMFSELDVRETIRQNRDPLPEILQKVKSLQEGAVLCIVNSFEPLPLVQLLRKQGFESYTNKISPAVFRTYFLKTGRTRNNSEKQDHREWDELILRFEGKTDSIDVRHLEMPGPMVTILGSLENLAPGRALFVHHRKVPVFLFPELAERKLSFALNERENEVQLLIYRES